MAKADDASSTIDWILLSVALELTVAALGCSVRLAKELLVQWMVAGKLPWSCLEWEGPNVAWIAMLEELNSQLKFRRLPVASPAHHEGDPEFLRAATIDWENNTAHDEARGGAKAWGMQTSRTHLLELLRRGRNPEARERETTPEPTKPVKREKLEPKAALQPEEPREREKAQGSVQWLAADIERMREAKKISRNITITELSRKLERRMDTAARSDKPIRIRPIKARSIENLLRVCGLWPIPPSK